MSSKFLLDFDSGFTITRTIRISQCENGLCGDDESNYISTIILVLLLTKPIHIHSSSSFSLFFSLFYFYTCFSLVSIFSDNILTISIDYHKNNHHHQHHSALECQCYVIWMPNSKFQFSTDTIKRFTLTFTIIICCDFRFMWKIWFYFCLQWRLLRIEMNTLCIGKQKKDKKTEIILFGSRWCLEMYEQFCYGK